MPDDAACAARFDGWRCTRDDPPHLLHVATTHKIVDGQVARDALVAVWGPSEGISAQVGLAGEFVLTTRGAPNGDRSSDRRAGAAGA